MIFNEIIRVSKVGIGLKLLLPSLLSHNRCTVRRIDMTQDDDEMYAITFDWPYTCNTMLLKYSENVQSISPYSHIYTSALIDSSNPGYRRSAFHLPKVASLHYALYTWCTDHQIIKIDSTFTILTITYAHLPTIILPSPSMLWRSNTKRGVTPECTLWHQQK